MSSEVQATPAQETPTAEVATKEVAASPVIEPVIAETKVTPEPAKTEEVVTDPKTETPKVEAPVVPEKYDLKLTKGSPLDATAIEKISVYAKEKGLSNEQAQALLDQRSEAVSEFASKQTEELKTRQSTWVSQVENDKEIGGKAYGQSVEYAKRAVERFGDDVLKKELNDSGLGNHPAVVRVFARIGKAMSDDKLVTAPSQTTNKKSVQDILYGDSKEK